MKKLSKKGILLGILLLLIAISSTILVLESDKIAVSSNLPNTLLTDESIMDSRR